MDTTEPELSDMSEWDRRDRATVPQYTGKGYTRLTQDEQPAHPKPVGYTPAPQSFPPPPPQQSSFSNNSSNVVVVGQPAATPQPETVVVESRPDDHLILTLCLMVLCCLSGNLTAFVCLIPALILSLSAGSANNSGDYETARRYARMSCFCSLCSVAVYIVAFVIGLVMTILFFTVGLEFISQR